MSKIFKNLFLFLGIIFIIMSFILYRNGNPTTEGFSFSALVLFLPVGFVGFVLLFVWFLEYFKKPRKIK